MRCRSAWGLAGLLAALLFLAEASEAAIQVRKQVCSLDVGGWLLCEGEGRVYLVASRWADTAAIRDRVSRKWHLSAPTLSNGAGAFLAADKEAKGRKHEYALDKLPKAVK